MCATAWLAIDRAPRLSLSSHKPVKSTTARAQHRSITAVTSCRSDRSGVDSRPTRSVRATLRSWAQGFFVAPCSNSVGRRACNAALCARTVCAASRPLRNFRPTLAAACRSSGPVPAHHVGIPTRCARQLLRQIVPHTMIGTFSPSLPQGSGRTGSRARPTATCWMGSCLTKSYAGGSSDTRWEMKVNVHMSGRPIACPGSGAFEHKSVAIISKALKSARHSNMMLGAGSRGRMPAACEYYVVLPPSVEGPAAGVSAPAGGGTGQGRSHRLPGGVVARRCPPGIRTAFESLGVAWRPREGSSTTTSLHLRPLLRPCTGAGGGPPPPQSCGGRSSSSRATRALEAFGRSWRAGHVSNALCCLRRPQLS